MPQQKKVRLPDGRIVAFPASMSDEEISAVLGRESLERAGVTLPKPQPTGTILGTQFGTDLRELALGAADTTLPGGQHISLPTGRELVTVATNPLATVKELGSMGLETVGALLSFLTAPGRPAPLTPQQSEEYRKTFGQEPPDVLNLDKRMEEIGPPLSREEAMFRAGQIGGAVLGALIPGTKGGRAAIGKVGGAVPKTIEKVGGAVAETIAARPKVTFTKAMRELPDRVFQALKPSKMTRLNVRDAMPAALNDLVATATELGMKVESIEDMANVVRASKRMLNEDLGKLAPRGLSVDGDELAAEIAKVRRTFETKFIEKGTGKEVYELPPGISESAFAELDDAIAKFKGRLLTLDQAEEMRRGVNARLNSFMRKNQIKQGKEAASNPSTAIDLALRDALESGINKSLNKAGFPASSPFRKRYANIRTLEDSILDRYLSEMTGEEAAFFNLDSLDTITAGSSASFLLFGEPSTAAALATTVAARHVINAIRKRLSNPDRLIKKAFEDVVGSEFAPKMNRADIPQRKALPSPSVQITPESPNQPIPAAGARRYP